MKSIVEISCENANKFGDRIAYTFLKDYTLEEQNITFHNLDKQARLIADTINNISVEGDRVLLLFPSGVDYIEAFWGTLYSHAIAVPAYPPKKNKSIDRLISIIEDCEATTILSTSKLIGEIKERIQNIDQGLIKHFISVDQLCIEKKTQSVLKKEIDSIAFLQYTSGSTGTPKGVQVTHRNIIVNEEMIKNFGQYNQDTICGGWLPFFHDMGLIANIIQPMYSGCRSILMSPVEFVQRPISWLKAISKYKINTSGGPNFGYEHCYQKIKEEEVRDLDLSSWEVAFSGSEPISDDTLKKFEAKFSPIGFRKKSFLPCYGMAEATLFITGVNKDAVYKTKKITATEFSNGKEQIFVGCGNGPDNQKLAIVDPNTRQLKPDKEIGEIWVSGDHVANGYWKNIELSQFTFHAKILEGEGDNYLRTGDMGFKEDGQLYIVGRLKDLIIINGANYYPQDIEESIFNSHEAFKTNSCAAFNDLNGKLIIVQELERSWLKHNDFEDLKKIVLTCVAIDFEISVHQIVFIKTGALPKTSSGKIQRSKTSADLEVGSLDVIYEWKKASVDHLTFNKEEKDYDTELIKLLADITGISKEKIQPEDTFDILGLDSVSGILFIDKINSAFNKQINPTAIYNYPTISKFSSYLKGDFIMLNNQIKPITTSDIAIIGYACKFPQANNIDAFWEILKEGRSAITVSKIKNRHQPDSSDLFWNGGYIYEPDLFDADFFNISRVEAEKMDPQQRITLETSWHCFEEAGISPQDLKGQKVGVFVGCGSADYSFIYDSSENLDPYYGSGNSNSIIANRISYFYDFTGPSMAIDTACSSSLSALNIAKLSLLQGECDLALVGGVNMLLNDNLNYVFKSAGMLSDDGICKTFDHQANGYVRGEGCGFLLLQEKGIAVNKGNKIHALLKSVVINQDGKTNGLTAPNGESQKILINKALLDASLRASEISIIEAHGTGTSLGDPIEVNALQEVFQTPDLRDNPLILGSVKANIGHLEAAAGMAGIIKGLLVLKNRQYPKQINFNVINPHIYPFNNSIQIPLENIDLKQPTISIGVSSFGFGGTNGHAIIQNYNEVLKKPTKNKGLYIKISAQSETSFFCIVSNYLDKLTTSSSFNPSHSLFTANHKFRIIITANTKEELVDQLEQISCFEKFELIPKQINFNVDQQNEMKSILNTARNQFDFSILPLYPFNKKSYWYPIIGKEKKENVTITKSKIDDLIRLIGENSRDKIESFFAEELDALPNYQVVFLPQKPVVHNQLSPIGNTMIFFDAKDLNVDFIPSTTFQQLIKVQHNEYEDFAVHEDIIKMNFCNPHHYIKLKAHSQQININIQNIVFYINHKKSLEEKHLDDLMDGAKKMLLFGQFVQENQKQLAVERILIITESLNKSKFTAPFYALQKTLSIEVSNISTQLIEIEDGVENFSMALAQLKTELNESHIKIYHGGAIKVARLIKQVIPNDKKIQLEKEGFILVTGASGSVGRKIINHYINEGHYKFITVSRSSVFKPTEESINFQTDISKPENIQSLFSSLKESNIKLTGIIHLAGVKSDSLLQNKKLDDLLTIIATKSQSAYILHQESKSHPLAFFLCMSSMVSITGSIGQFDYIIANKFIDELITYRNSKGLVGTSINLGPVAGTGMAANLDYQQYGENALVKLDFNQVVKEFQNILGQTGQLGIFKINFKSFYDDLSISPFYEQVIPFKKEIVTSKLIDDLKFLSISERKERLINFLASTLKNILKHEGQLSNETGLAELGVDSIMLVKFQSEIKQHLGLNLPIADFFNFKNILELQKHLYEQLYASEHTKQIDKPEKNMLEIKSDHEMEEVNVEMLLEEKLRELKF